MRPSITLPAGGPGAATGLTGDAAELRILGLALEARVDGIVAAGDDGALPDRAVGQDLARVRRLSTVAVAHWLAGGDPLEARRLGHEASGIFARLALDHRVSLDDMTKRCLRWRDEIAKFLTETAAVLGLGSATLDRALGMMQRSSDVTLVRMCQNFENDRRESQARIEGQHQEMLYRAVHDSLTGLPNRVAFGNRLRSALRAQPPLPIVAVLLLDLNQFKEINDTLGHAWGDQLLTAVATRFTDAIGTSGLVARLGGDEFGVLISGLARASAATAFAECLLGALGEPFRVAGVDLAVSASVGIAVAPDHGQDGELLVQRADCAMYQAKGSITHIAVYDPEVDQHSLRRLELVHDLHRAIDDDQLVLHYQPKIELHSGDTVGIEALVRWQHPSHGLLGPDAFVPLAETSGLIRHLTRWVVHQALAQLALWRAAGFDLELAVNVSAQDFATEDLYDEVIAALTESGMSADRLVLELTERDVMTNTDDARSAMERLRAVGVRISLDDFGTGRTSLAYLGTFPIDELKIDRSFLSDDPDDVSRTVLTSIISLGRALGHTVVAEGIEDLGMLQLLRDAGCHQAQGYAIARPLCATELEDWLLRR